MKCFRTAIACLLTVTAAPALAAGKQYVCGQWTLTQFALELSADMRDHPDRYYGTLANPIISGGYHSSYGGAARWTWQPIIMPSCVVPSVPQTRGQAQAARMTPDDVRDELIGERLSTQQAKPQRGFNSRKDR